MYARQGGEDQHKTHLEGTSGRAEVKEALHTTVNLEARNDEHLSQNQLIERLAVELLAGIELILLGIERLGIDLELLEEGDGLGDVLRGGAILLELADDRALLGHLRGERVDLVLER